jgi:hypothetical protein
MGEFSCRTGWDAARRAEKMSLSQLYPPARRHASNWNFNFHCEHDQLQPTIYFFSKLFLLKHKRKGNGTEFSIERACFAKKMLHLQQTGFSYFLV